MAQITTTLPIEFSGNNDSYPYTREKDILEMSIQAPKINYLPYNIIEKHCKCNITNGTDGNFYEKHGRLFHYDYNYLPYSAGGAFLRIPLLNFLQNDLEGTFTFVYKILNYSGDFIKNWQISLTNLKNGYISYPAYFNLEHGEGLYYITFNKTSEVGYLKFNTSAWTQPFDAVFDLEVIGLFEGDESQLINLRQSESIFEDIKISTSNTEAVLGDYEISRKIRRHIDQIERKIVLLDDVYKLDWR